MGTLGHNVMLWAESDAYAVWMVAATSDRQKVADFFASTRQDLDADNGFVSPEDWAHAPFPTYVVKQRVGDLVLVPAEAPHMVINQVQPRHDTTHTTPHTSHDALTFCTQCANRAGSLASLRGIAWRPRIWRSPSTAPCPPSATTRRTKSIVPRYSFFHSSHVEVLQ